MLNSVLGTVPATELEKNTCSDEKLSQDKHGENIPQELKAIITLFHTDCQALVSPVF